MFFLLLTKNGCGGSGGARAAGFGFMFCGMKDLGKQLRRKHPVDPEKG